MSCEDDFLDVIHDGMGVALFIVLSPILLPLYLLGRVSRIVVRRINEASK